MAAPTLVAVGHPTRAAHIEIAGPVTGMGSMVASRPLFPVQRVSKDPHRYGGRRPKIGVS